MLLVVFIIGNGFNIMMLGYVEGLFEFVSYFVIGLIIGILVIVFIQLFSMVILIIVVMVVGGLFIILVVLMMMGVNVGISIINMIVSMGYIYDKWEYEKVFQVVIIYDVFNVMVVIIFLLLEVFFGILEYLSGWMVSWMYSDIVVVVGGFNFIKVVIKLVNEQLQWLLGDLFNGYVGVIMIILGIGLIVVLIMFLGCIMKVLMVGCVKLLLYKSIGRGFVLGIVLGIVVIVFVQFLLIIILLMVFLVGSGVLIVCDIYLFIFGVNIGICIMVLIVVLGIIGVMVELVL